MEQDPFKEYLQQSDPSKRQKGYAWSTAIGLQNVDGLKPSSYLLDTAKRNIEGEISIEQAQAFLNTYYQENPVKSAEDRTEEADKVSARIAKLLSEQAFSFTTSEYISIHKQLFTGIYEHAGQIRTYNITKKEWVLDGDTVVYGTASELKDTITYDLTEEKTFSYQRLAVADILHHLAVFVAGLWQIHAFAEGNTRTTAVFFIKYLRTLGYDVTNDIFAKHAWYFRNALVRANYNDLKHGVHATTEFLELFLRNLLLKEQNPLSNRMMHISHAFEKVDIDPSKVDIQAKKVDIERIIEGKLPTVSDKTKTHIAKLYAAHKTAPYFGRTDVAKVLGLKPAMTSRMLQMLLKSQLIEPVKGKGKGKYRFIQF